ncbi:30S ribosomal protein S12 methylthiotransferase RimO [candidate division GN15 bacterium]|uniref:Ribosomal protein uS12 methylthiotransferase RimO n=1 Tax=candidate division GN15 bacterium TaxID=2072418 RepID=A0A855XD17_9BACT|nr:MAG: 30S ribosomal protein S12 methylthiotransferase RimO [candidate division GN15 bacterium]
MRVYIQKLGCPKNDVDAEYIAGRLVDDGHEVVASAELADAVIVNTCGFILPAKEESINEILRLGQLKKAGVFQRLYATGCLSQKHGDEMLKGMPELDGAFGLGALDALAKTIGSGAVNKKTFKTESRHLGYMEWRDRFLFDSLPYAYVKISDGCDRACSYCTIPSIRGRYRSRPLASIVREAAHLAANGKRELILVSQEATMWGTELPGSATVIDLLQALDRVSGIEWIRLMYLHPAALTDELIDYMAAPGNKTLAYFDLPLQHVNDDILKRMRRTVGRAGIERMLDRIRMAAPHGTLRTTFIVGLPGETERRFGELVEFMERWKFDRLGVFPYSAEAGTPAQRMPGQVPERVKNERVDIVMSRQREYALAQNERLTGTTVEVLIDSVSEGEAIGRTRADCPEIDQEVHITGDGLAVGSICRVRVEAADGYDLRGTPAKEQP